MIQPSIVFLASAFSAALRISCSNWTIGCSLDRCPLKCSQLCWRFLFRLCLLEFSSLFKAEHNAESYTDSFKQKSYSLFCTPMDFFLRHLQFNFIVVIYLFKSFYETFVFIKGWWSFTEHFGMLFIILCLTVPLNNC